MSDFDKNMRLKEKAEEDIYFARRSRELIKALHEEQSAETAEGSAVTNDSHSEESVEHASEDAQPVRYGPGVIARYLRKLIGR